MLPPSVIFPSYGWDIRADRLLAVLLLLQRRGLVTVAELARRLEVSTRTVHRDLESLGAAGIPIYTQPGRGGGVGMLETYRTDLTGLSLGEAELLPLLGLGDALSAMGLRSSLAQTETKVLAALPEAQRARAEEMRSRIHVDLGAWWHGTEVVEQMAVLTEATFTARRVHVHYQRPGADRAVARTLAPLGLVLKAGVWYLVAHAGAGDPRVYRASRVADAQLTDEHFEPPPDFDLAGFWSARTEEFQNTGTAYEVVVRARPDAVRALRNERETPAASYDEWTDVNLTFGTKEHALRRLLTFGPSIEVLEPDELRLTLAQTVRETSVLYQT